MSTRVGDTSADADFLTNEFFSYLLDFVVLDLKAVFWITLGSNDRHITEESSTWIIWVFLIGVLLRSLLLSSGETLSFFSFLFRFLFSGGLVKLFLSFGGCFN